MLRLKDIAHLMDDCHQRTAKRWWKKLDAECRAAGLPGVAPDVAGHGAHKWTIPTAERLLNLWATYYSQRGITFAIARAKFNGKFTAGLAGNTQLELIPSHEKSAVHSPARTGQKAGNARRTQNAAPA
jgi:hypothetical protein